MRLIRNVLVCVLAGVLSGALVLSAGCGREESRAEARPAGGGEPEAATNRVEIPAAVRANLGVTFVEVEPRRVEQTLRAPGRFELLPSARREYRTMLPGRIDLGVEELERVEAGRVLYTIDSPGWRALQQEISEAGASIARAETSIDSFGPLLTAHEEHEASLDASVAVWGERIAQLESLREAGGGRVAEMAAARASLASARAELADVREKKAELRAAAAQASSDLQAAISRRELLLESASSLTGLDVGALESRSGEGPGARPRWRTIESIEVRSEGPGVVESLGVTEGAWADEKVAVVTVVRPDRLRFRASGLQSDLGVLREGLPARIVPPTATRASGSVDMGETMTGSIRLGISGDAADRTLDLFVTPETLASWARPGVSAQLEIVTDATAAAELAIPLAAVQRDGLTPVIFRRDPANPDRAIRLEADLGIDDGRWVTVRSGVRAGDEVVLDGAFQLMLATSGSMQRGGHFHSDGTFHEGED